MKNKEEARALLLLLEADKEFRYQKSLLLHTIDDY